MSDQPPQPPKTRMVPASEIAQHPTQSLRAKDYIEQQWESQDPRAPLPIPKERLAAQRYRWTAPAPISLSGTCAGWSVGANGGVQLRDVFVDTSERFQGAILTKRVTHHEELNLVATPVLIFPLKGADDE